MSDSAHTLYTDVCNDNIGHACHKLFRAKAVESFVASCHAYPAGVCPEVGTIADEMM